MCVAANQRCRKKPHLKAEGTKSATKKSKMKKRRGASFAKPGKKQPRWEGFVAGGLADK